MSWNARRTKTEAGQGGKKGHSNMTHWAKTAEVKANARKARRTNDKREARDGHADTTR